MGALCWLQSTRELLRGHLVVYLSVGLSEATRRVGLSAARPVLALNPRAQLASLLAQRLPLYREVATIEVPTDGQSPQEVAAAVLASGTDVAGEP